MAKKLTEQLEKEIKQEFIEGYVNGSNIRVYPTIEALSKRHDVARATIYRRADKNKWQQAKNRFQTELEEKNEKIRLNNLVAENKRLDNNSLQIAQALLQRVGSKIQKAMEEEKSNGNNPITSQELRELSHVAANAQKIGKLALGEAQEISKVSADVSKPESFDAIMEQLDELAEARTQGSNHTIQ
jgi:hypothetical protein